PNTNNKVENNRDVARLPNGDPNNPVTTQPNATGLGDPTNPSSPSSGGGVAVASAGNSNDGSLRASGGPGSSLVDQPLPTPDKIMSGQVHGYSLNINERRGRQRRGENSGRGLASVAASGGINGSQSPDRLAQFKRLMRQRGYYQSRGIASTSPKTIFGDRNSSIFYSMCMHYKFYEMQNKINNGESRCPKP
ncbi:MAG: hypothetical protein MJK18_11695, partial [Bdellovibrionales bacterium]|nr:hypothetical protein [Bdellovibrionales bacterium]